MPKFFASDAGLVANCLDWNEEETFVAKGTSRSSAFGLC